MPIGKKTVIKLCATIILDNGFLVLFYLHAKLFHEFQKEPGHFSGFLIAWIYGIGKLFKKSISKIQNFIMC